MRLENKVVVVTGAARHIGQAFAVRAAREGANVVVADKADCSETAQMVAAEGARVLALTVDVTDEQQTLAMARDTAAEFGHIDVLVNNAGLFDGLVAKPFMEVDLDLWDKVFAVNVKGIFLCTRAVFPYMRDQGKGKIVNIGSGIWLHGVTGIPHYVASKAAVTGLSRTLARELGPYNINVNTLAPGGTESGAHRHAHQPTPWTSPQPGRSARRPHRHHGLPGLRRQRFRDWPDDRRQRWRQPHLVGMMNFMPCADCVDFAGLLDAEKSGRSGLCCLRWKREATARNRKHTLVTILLAEDNALIRISVRETLRRMGHEVLEAVNGIDAVRLYRGLVPDCVLMDVGMPAKDGLTAFREILEFDPQARVAMFTAYGMDNIVEQARELGAMDFIVKPFVRSRLVSGVDRMLRNLPEQSAVPIPMDGAVLSGAGVLN
jgi:3-oxoacyl-[acyl-carrier protein] reductase